MCICSMALVRLKTNPRPGPQTDVHFPAVVGWDCTSVVPARTYVQIPAVVGWDCTSVVPARTYVQVPAVVGWDCTSVVPAKNPRANPCRGGG
jgi:hypothetical protein